MKKYNLYCMLLFILVCSQAKAQYLRDYTGKQYSFKTGNDVSGSVLLTENWFPGIINFADGKTANALLNYDTYGDELLFKTSAESGVQAFADPVKSFSAKYVKLEGTDQTDIVFSCGFPAVDGQTAKTFYQVVGDGNLKLLKLHKKKVLESKDFSSQMTTKTLTGTISYYLLANNQLTKIKPSQKTILAAMNDKVDKVQEYLKTNKIDFKSDVALAKLFAYYNSL